MVSVDMQRRIDDLPKVFQERISGFMSRNKTFDIDFLGYEVFCCEQAVLIAKTFDTEETLIEFAQSDAEDQYKKMPSLSKEHSGNTMGTSLSLAFVSLTPKEDPLILHLHGALCPLVGCDAYGCWSTTQNDSESTTS